MSGARAAATSPRWIPLHRTSCVGRELEYVRQAVEGGHLAGAGSFTQRCERWLERQLGAPRVLLTSSCTHALEMCGLLLDLATADEVIVPAFSFVSTANAFLLRGARPVFADVRPGTLNLDPERVEERVGERTRAIVALHYGGVGCAMDELGAIAGARGLAVVEDNAHGLFGSYRGSALGTLAPLAGLSFHGTKNVTCGEGGALVINDPGLVQRAENLRDKGTDRNRFLRGETSHYSWVDLGSSYFVSELAAAFLLGQLERSAEIQARREHLWTVYADGLRAWAAEGGVVPGTIPDDRVSSHHIFYLILPNRESRRRLIQHLAARGIEAAFHYLPLHLSAMGRRLGGREGDCPVAEDLSQRLVRLPLYHSLRDEDQERVLEAVTEFRAA